MNGPPVKQAKLMHPAKDDSLNDATPVLDFEKFSVDQVLFQNPTTKSIGLKGTFTTNTEAPHSNDYAVIIAEKQPLTDSNLTELFSSRTKVTRNFQNDIYAQYMVSPCEGNHGTGEVKMTTVYPATEQHVQKYSEQEYHVIHESPEDYARITKPFIEKQAFDIEWVTNILEGKAEADRVLHSDPDPATGFVLLPDLKWDQSDLSNLYMLALVRPRGILSMRELTDQHMALLRNILHKGKEVIREKYGLSEDMIRAYIHYQPSYYHLHVHFTHMKFDAPRTTIGHAHFLEDVIDNIEAVDPYYYQKRTISFVVKETSRLWVEFKDKYT